MKPIETYGYEAVGRGWRFILEALDALLVNYIQYAEPGTLVIDQVKEKFGGLRVYYTPKDMRPDIVNEIEGAIRMAEYMAIRTCEYCGQTEGVENRPIKNVKYSWSLTLCETCHFIRDESWRRGENKWPPTDPVPASEVGIKGETDERL